MTTDTDRDRMLQTHESRVAAIVDALTATDAEDEVARRLRRVAKALPQTSMPSRRSGGAA